METQSKIEQIITQEGISQKLAILIAKKVSTLILAPEKKEKETEQKPKPVQPGTKPSKKEPIKVKRKYVPQGSGKGTTSKNQKR